MPPPTWPPPATRPTPTSPPLVPPVEAPWYAALAVLVTAGRLTVAVADVIHAGLGEITDAVTADDLEAALAELLTDLLGADGTHRVHVAEARTAARAARDRIDISGVAVRESALREKQYWRQWIGPDGMYRGEYALDPENGALLQAVHDQLTHPRRQPDPKTSAPSVLHRSGIRSSTRRPGTRRRRRTRPPRPGRRIRRPDAPARR